MASLEYSNKDNAADGINGVAAQTRWNTTPAPQVYLNADYTATPNLVLHAGFDFTRHAAMQNSAVQNFKATTLGLNTAANMPGGAANTFPIFNGLTVNRQSVPQMGINNAPFIDDNWYNTESAIWAHGRHTFEFGGDFRHQLFGTHNDLSAGVYSFSPIKRLCLPPRAKTFMEPASATVSRASLSANWVAQASGTITFNGFTAWRAGFTRWTPGSSHANSR